jgi:hypothetical protein
MTIKEVYGKDISELKAPDGYEFTGEFREALKSEIFLSNKSRDPIPIVADYITPYSRLILKNKEF